MSQSRIELKVGMFILFCLVLFAGLLLQFSKGVSPFRESYTIIVDAGNVDGLRVKASVLMSGVQIGSVSEMTLSPEGTNVAIRLKLFSKYKILDDAVFKIEQSGFLGDKYIAIDPGKTAGKPLESGVHVHAESPFNLQEVARATSGFIQRMDGIAKKLDDTIEQIHRIALNETTLTNLSTSIANFRRISEDTLVTVDNINVLIKTNGVPVANVLSNLQVFSDQLNVVAARAQDLLKTNSPPINSAVSNIQASAASLANILAEVQSGKGLAGALVKNQAVADNVANITGNLSITTSNLNRLGFWHFLFYKPKPETADPHWPTNSNGKLSH